jgi:hypothetical protein
LDFQRSMSTAYRYTLTVAHCVMDEKVVQKYLE